MRISVFILGIIISLLFSLHTNADTSSVAVWLHPIPKESFKVAAHPKFDLHYWCEKNERIPTKIQYYPARNKAYKDKTIAFYTLYFLTLLLGIIRYTDPKYFRDLWGMFWGLAKVNRDSKEHLHGAAVSNLLMNIFFVCTLGVFIFFTIEHRVTNSLNFPLGLLPLLLVCCVLIIYLAYLSKSTHSNKSFLIKKEDDLCLMRQSKVRRTCCYNRALTFEHYSSLLLI